MPSFGDPAARLLVVGLAPGLAGANRTGRPFTGDVAGELLYPTLRRFGFARGTYRARPDDGFELVDCRVTNAVRCVPPHNRPTAREVANCRIWLEPELLLPPRPVVVLSLGRVAWDAVLRVFGKSPARDGFAHGAELRLDGAAVLLGSYHTSRYNLNTGRLTPGMFEAVVARAREIVDRHVPARRGADSRLRQA